MRRDPSAPERAAGRSWYGLNAPPVDGAANRELIGVLATVLGVPKRAIAIVAGERSRHKRVRIEGLDLQTAEARLRG